MICGRRSFFLSVLTLAVCAACTSLPPASTAPARARGEVGDFTLEGRFALQVSRPEGRVDKAAGRLHWQHDSSNARDLVRLATPLGSGLAELQYGPGAALLITSDRQQRHGTDPAALLLEVTGYPLPVEQLPGWLLGRPAAQDVLSRDPQQRPLRLESPPWRIEYRYSDTHPDSLPQRLDISHPEIGLRLFIEQWQTP